MIWLFILVQLGLVGFFSYKWHTTAMSREFFRISLQSVSNELDRLSDVNVASVAGIEARDAIIANLRTEVAEFTNLNRCYSSDGLTCGWHNTPLQQGNCTISNKRVWEGARKVYRPQGRATGSQFVRRMEAQAAMEE